MFVCQYCFLSRSLGAEWDKTHREELISALPCPMGSTPIVMLMEDGSDAITSGMEVVVEQSITQFQLQLLGDEEYVTQRPKTNSIVCYIPIIYIE